MNEPEELMKTSEDPKDRRRAPRLLMDLPVEYRVINAPYAHGGVVVNASTVGLLIQSVKNIPVGAQLSTVVLFPEGYALRSLEVLAEVVWKDVHRNEDWDGFHYGLNVIRIKEGDEEKLKQLLETPEQEGGLIPPDA